MRGPRVLVLAVLTLGALAGCLGPSGPAPAPVPADEPPFLGYEVRKPDMGLELLESEALIDAGDVQIHVRVKRPDVAEKVPVIVQFTPYTAGVGAAGQNPALNGVAEPAGCAVVAGDCESNFDLQFVRRGYAFAYGDVRGTGDSSGCLSLRGPEDVADAAKVIEWLGTRDWSNGKVGFIGASYPGSEAHIAAIAEAGARTGHLGAVIPVVASTSFYHYHHNDGVPYTNHGIGATNTGYTTNAVAPTINPQNPNYLTKYLEELTCPTKENVLDHGGLDQSGAYYKWWQDRNLRGHARNVTVPVLMAQGLADWNVKPDHVAHYYNDLAGPKTFIGGQWGHQYPRSAGDCREYTPSTGCDPNIPWGDWWEYATAFFDTHLKGIDTGMFASDVAWVQDSGGAWHRSVDWPLRGEDRGELVLHLRPDGTLSSAPYAGDPSQETWVACPHDQVNRGTPLGAAEAALTACDDEAPVEQLVFDSEPFAQDTLLSGVGVVRVAVHSTADTTHLVVVLQRMKGGEIVAARENYGYLNPIYRAGLEEPSPLPEDGYVASIDLYPQEDLVKAGEHLRLIVRSNDEGRTIEAYEPGYNSILFSADTPNTLWLPVRPADLQGVRLG
jgi:putative CocE/NonD family hydrolase